MKFLNATLVGLLGLFGAATMSHAADAPTNTVVLGGGCFWCLEHDFRGLKGVTKAVSGYSGGSIAKPTYDTYHDVSTANPVPHVEVAEITYDTTKLSYDQVIDYYFKHIDPTDGGGQFCDRGASYRPVIFYGNDAEKTAAEAKKADVAKVLKAKIKVDILPAKTFWPAEGYHQDYADKNPLKYKFYRWNCGRDQRVKEVWGALTN